MRGALSILVLSVLVTAGCGGPAPSGPSPAGCFVQQPGVAYIDRPAVYVANAGSSSISAFLPLGSPHRLDLVCGSPFRVSDPPTALAGGEVIGEQADLVVLSAPGKTISFFRVDVAAGGLTGPLLTLHTPYTPVAAMTMGGSLYVADGQSGVWGYQLAGSPGAPTAAEVPGSPFSAGAGPAAIAAIGGPSWLYVANSQSNDVSGYSTDPATGALIPLPGTPFPAGTQPSSIAAWPPQYPSPTGGATVVVVTNAGSNDVSVFQITSGGSLTPVPGSPFAAGSGPSSTRFGNGLPLSHLYVANSKSNDISGYNIDDATGVLTPAAGSPFPAGASPSSLAMGFGWGVFVANQSSNNLSFFYVSDQQTGALVPVGGSPFAVGESPQAVLFFQVPE